MYNLTPKVINRTLTDAGCTLPRKAVDAFATLEALQTASLADPIPAAVEAASTMTATTARRALEGLATALVVRERHEAARAVLEQPVARRYHDAIRAHADDLVQQLKPTFDQAAGIVHRAGRAFPPNADKAAVIDAGDDAVQAYRNLDEALDTLGRIRSARATIGDLTGEPEQDVTWYITAARDADHLNEARRIFYGPGHAFHALAWAGFTLSLNTTRQANSVATKAAETTANALAAETEAHAAELREANAGWLNG